MTDDWRGESHICVTPDPHAARGMNMQSVASQTPKPIATRKPKPKASTAAIIARREKVARLIKRGDSMVRAAEVLGLTYHTVYEDCKVMEILPPRKRA